jgi:hypothetical protein
MVSDRHMPGLRYQTIADAVTMPIVAGAGGYSRRFSFLPQLGPVLI